MLGHVAWFWLWVFRSSSGLRGLTVAHRILLYSVPTSVACRFMKVYSVPTSPNAWQPSSPSASGPKLVPSLRVALYRAAVSPWVSSGVVSAFWITWHRSSQMQVLQKPWWVELEFSSCHVKPHSAARQLPSWPWLLVFPTRLPALTSPSKPGSSTYSWHKIPKPVQFLPQQMQAEPAELELKHMLKCTHEFIVWVESHTLT